MSLSLFKKRPISSTQMNEPIMVIDGNLNNEEIGGSPPLLRKKNILLQQQSL